MQRRSALQIDASSLQTKFRDLYMNMKTRNAKNVILLLHEARCEIEDDMERCEEIENYLNSPSVMYEDVILFNDEEQYPEIHNFKNTILDAILNEFNEFFPDGDLKNFNVLDPKNMPLADDRAGCRTYGIVKIGELNKYFKFTEDDNQIISQ